MKISGVGHVGAPCLVFISGLCSASCHLIPLATSPSRFHSDQPFSPDALKAEALAVRFEPAQQVQEREQKVHAALNALEERFPPETLRDLSSGSVQDSLDAARASGLQPLVRARRDPLALPRTISSLLHTARHVVANDVNGGADLAPSAWSIDEILLGPQVTSAAAHLGLPLPHSSGQSLTLIHGRPAIGSRKGSAGSESGFRLSELPLTLSHIRAMHVGEFYSIPVEGTFVTRQSQPFARSLVDGRSEQMNLVAFSGGSLLADSVSGELVLSGQMRLNLIRAGEDRVRIQLQRETSIGATVENTTSLTGTLAAAFLPVSRLDTLRRLQVLTSRQPALAKLRSNLDILSLVGRSALQILKQQDIQESDTLQRLSTTDQWEGSEGAERWQGFFVKQEEAVRNGRATATEALQVMLNALFELNQMSFDLEAALQELLEGPAAAVLSRNSALMRYSSRSFSKSASLQLRLSDVRKLELFADYTFRLDTEVGATGLERALSGDLFATGSHAAFLEIRKQLEQSAVTSKLPFGDADREPNVSNGESPANASPRFRSRVFDLGFAEEAAVAHAREQTPPVVRNLRIERSRVSFSRGVQFSFFDMSSSFFSKKDRAAVSVQGRSELFGDSTSPAEDLVRDMCYLMRMKQAVKTDAVSQIAVENRQVSVIAHLPSQAGKGGAFSGPCPAEARPRLWDLITPEQAVPEPEAVGFSYRASVVFREKSVLPYTETLTAARRLLGRLAPFVGIDLLTRVETDARSLFSLSQETSENAETEKSSSEPSLGAFEPETLVRWFREHLKQMQSRKKTIFATGPQASLQLAFRPQALDLIFNGGLTETDFDRIIRFIDRTWDRSDLFPMTLSGLRGHLDASTPRLRQNLVEPGLAAMGAGPLARRFRYLDDSAMRGNLANHFGMEMTTRLLSELLFEVLIKQTSAASSGDRAAADLESKIADALYFELTYDEHRPVLADQTFVHRYGNDSYAPTLHLLADWGE